MPWFFILVQPKDIYMEFSVFMTITQKTEDTTLDVAPQDQVKIYILCYSFCNADLNLSNLYCYPVNSCKKKTKMSKFGNILQGYHHKNCKWTDWVNTWDETFNYFAPDGYVIRDVFSIHNNYTE